MRRRVSTISISGNSTVREVVSQYYTSPQFISLRHKTQGNYEYNLERACKTKVDNNRVLGDVKLKYLGQMLSFEKITPNTDSYESKINEAFR